MSDNDRSDNDRSDDKHSCSVDDGIAGPVAKAIAPLGPPLVMAALAGVARVEGRLAPLTITVLVLVGGVIWLVAEGLYRHQRAHGDRLRRPALIAGFTVLVLMINVTGAAWTTSETLPSWGLWVLIVLGGSGLVAYWLRLTDLMPDPRLEWIWRAGGSRRSDIESMGRELDDLIETQQEQGRPMPVGELDDVGLVVDWPDSVDPNRHWRVIVRAGAASISVTAVLAVLVAIGDRSWSAGIDKDLLSLAGPIGLLVSVNGLVLSGGGRRLLAPLVGALVIALVVLEGLAVEVHIPVPVLVAVAIGSGWVFWRTTPALPRSVWEYLDRLT